MSVQKEKLFFKTKNNYLTNIVRREIISALTLFRPGGAIVPALTLDVYNFFHKQSKPTKHGDFS